MYKIKYTFNKATVFDFLFGRFQRFFFSTEIKLKMNISFYLNIYL